MRRASLDRYPVTPSLHAGPGARVSKLTDGDLALPAASYMRVNMRLIEVNGEEARSPFIPVFIP